MAKSQLIQARLNPTDPERPYDAQAWAIIKAWRASGRADRDTVVTALLALDGIAVPTPTKDATLKKLLTLTTRLESLIAQLDNIDRSAAVYVEGPNAGQSVNFGVMDNILGSLQHRVMDDDDE